MLKELWLLVEVREQCSLLTLDLWSLNIASFGIMMYFKYLCVSFFNSKKYEEPNHFLVLWPRLILVDNEIGHFFKCHKIPGGQRLWIEHAEKWVTWYSFSLSLKFIYYSLYARINHHKDFKVNISENDFRLSK